MTETALTVVDSAETGVELMALAVQVATGGMNFQNTGSEIVYVYNNDASESVTVGITGQHICSCGVLHSPSVVVAAGKYESFGPLGIKHFNDSTGLCHLTFSATAADIKVVVVRTTSARG